MPTHSRSFRAGLRAAGCVEAANVDREWAAETLEHVKCDARTLLDQPQVLGADGGLIEEAIGPASIARYEAVSLGRIVPANSARRMRQCRRASRHVGAGGRGRSYRAFGDGHAIIIGAAGASIVGVDGIEIAHR